MTWLSSHIGQVLIILALATLALEVIVFGLSTFVLFFVGLGLLIVGLLMIAGILPQTIIAALAGVAIVSGGLAVALWKPLKNFQNRVERHPVSSDLIGSTFTLSEGVSPEGSGTQSYSGLSWRVTANEQLEVGTLVRVVQVNVGELKVERA